MKAPTARFYEKLAEWWPLFSPPPQYLEEPADLLPRLRPAMQRPEPTLLEPGSGGSPAYHLKRHFRMTLTDRGPTIGHGWPKSPRYVAS